MCNRLAVYCHPQGPRRSHSTLPVRPVMRRMKLRIFGTWRGALTRRWDERYINIYICMYVCGPGSLVGIATDYSLDGLGSNPGGDEIFCTCLDRPWGPPSPLYNGYRVFPGDKVWLGRAADLSPPSSSAVMEEYSQGRHLRVASGVTAPGPALEGAPRFRPMSLSSYILR